tara:strand:+ start:10974 stop:11318 length:345 start_codon:yes stop_codon:yes gene_type:complete
MDGVPAVYLGRIVSKENFRTFVYCPAGTQRLVESWDEYEQAMSSGNWFATLEDSKASEAVVEKPKRVRKPAKVSAAVEMLEADEADDGVEVVEGDDEGTFEVAADDGFLPKASK